MSKARRLTLLNVVLVLLERFTSKIKKLVVSVLHRKHPRVPLPLLRRPAACVQRSIVGD